MVSKEDIKGLEFDTIEEYFSYICDSITNGQRQQAIRLYRDLSTKQRRAFLDWLDDYKDSDESMTLLRILETTDN